ncbi:MAG: hypothetical protein HYT72_01775 [Candidatus Aenigmarchaeota archaeon]|nr:hypothetical protein [Candidatus Aenigmarchaeota archaeon]
MERKRITTMKTRIKPIAGGRYVAAQGFTPGYVITSTGMRLSRVRILATIVDKFLSESGKFASITLDDGTETIRAKAFNAVSIFNDVASGSVIDVIGKIKEYEGEIYLIPEVVKKVGDPNWEILRELELRAIDNEWDDKRKTVFEYQKQTADLAELKRVMKERFAILPQDVESICQSQDAEEPQEEPHKTTKDVILNLINRIDSGEGCDYSELIEKSGLSEDLIDSAVNDLLEEGVCFEPRPGKIKRL